MENIYNGADLTRDLQQLGVAAGSVLEVHSSLSAIGYVIGGAQTVIDALLEVVGRKGTLLMPTHTPELSGPEVWSSPPISATQAEKIREGLPVFDPKKILPVAMGIIPCTLLGYPRVRRSLHPISSFAAIGRYARYLCHDHSLLTPEGWQSPIGRLYELDGWILLLGVDNRRNTSIHLAETIADVGYIKPMPGKPNDHVKIQTVDGQIRFVTLTQSAQCSEGFIQAEPYLRQENLIIHGKVGDAPCQLMRQRPVVDLLIKLLKEWPTLLLCNDSDCRQCSIFREESKS